MKPTVFERSPKPIDAKEWLSSIQLIVDFMELNDREKALRASHILKKEAKYWWESINARRNV